MKKRKSSPRQKPIRGGRRQGAGRPTGTGKYGEPTKAVRVPQSLIAPLQKLLDQYPNPPTPALFKANALSSTLALPLYEDKVAAGFPSPAENEVDIQLDLNDYLVKNPASTFYVKVEGNSMLNAGIHPNDLLVVDRALTPTNGNIVIAFINGEFTVKRLKMKNQQIWLMPENDAYPPIAIKEDMDFRIWGVVTNVVHSVLK